MRSIKFIIVFMLLSTSVFSQNQLDSLLVAIEKNNTTMAAMRKNLEADRIGNKTGLLPGNPDIEFHYLFGNPTTIGNRTDFSVRQTFDFPTVYAHRNHISGLKNAQADLEYQRQRIDILHEASMLGIEEIYHNALLAEYNKRVRHAERIAETYNKKLDAGETNMLEHNKAQVNLLNLKKETEALSIERDALHAEIARLNGGAGFMVEDSVFKTPDLIPGFEAWYENAGNEIPVLQWLEHELKISEREKQLEVANSLPKFSAGYMSEKVVGEQFQGVAVGMSLPLWENRNAVKYAKLKTLAVEESKADAEFQIYAKLKAQYDKVKALQASIMEYQEQLLKYDNRKLAAKALERGEISLATYYIELSLYYSSVDKVLEMQRDLYLAYYALLKWSL